MAELSEDEWREKVAKEALDKLREKGMTWLLTEMTTLFHHSASQGLPPWAHLTEVDIEEIVGQLVTGSFILTTPVGDITVQLKVTATHE